MALKTLQYGGHNWALKERTGASPSRAQTMRYFLRTPNYAAFTSRKVSAIAPSLKICLYNVYEINRTQYQLQYVSPHDFLGINSNLLNLTVEAYATGWQT
jgi:hypothetical protein